MRTALLSLLTPCLLAGALLVAPPAPLHAEGDARATARATVEAKADAVIRIMVVSKMKMSFGGQSQERDTKREVLGFVVDGDGTAVTSLTMVDQSGMMEKLRGDEEMGLSTEVKEIKYIMADNSEVPATIVVRDNDLDIVVLRAIEPPKTPMTHIDLADSGSGAMLEEIFVLGRMGRIARRATTGMMGEIQAIVERPRAFYVPSSEIVTAGVGAPVFKGDGKLLGFVTLHAMPGAQEMGDDEESVMPIVLPASDVAEVVAQSRETATKDAAPAPSN